MKLNINWYKINPCAIIPTKDEGNAGFDVYTVEKDITIPPLGQHMFSTGLGAVMDKGLWLAAWDRGSTGSKGLHVHCGVIDNNYRGEIFICIKNDNPYEVRFTDDEEAGIHKHAETQWINDFQIKPIEVIDYLVYPTSKAIAQLIPMLQLDIESHEIQVAEGNKVKNTNRGEGKLGSSGK